MKEILLVLCESNSHHPWSLDCVGPIRSMQWMVSPCLTICKVDQRPNNTDGLSGQSSMPKAVANPVPGFGGLEVVTEEMIVSIVTCALRVLCRWGSDRIVSWWRHFVNRARFSMRLRMRRCEQHKQHLAQSYPLCPSQCPCSKCCSLPGRKWGECGGSVGNPCHILPCLDTEFIDPPCSFKHAGTVQAMSPLHRSSFASKCSHQAIRDNFVWLIYPVDMRTCVLLCKGLFPDWRCSTCIASTKLLDVQVFQLEMAQLTRCVIVPKARKTYAGIHKEWELWIQNPKFLCFLKPGKLALLDLQGVQREASA